MPRPFRSALIVLLAALPSLALADEAARPTKLTADFGYV